MVLASINSVPKALAVDDDEMFCQFVEAILESIGYTVSVALDGGRGVSLFEQFQPDLIVTDFDMPILDGLGMVERIRSKAAGAATPVMLLTGHDPAGLADRALRLGIVTVMRKPVTSDGLVAAVRKLAA